MKRPELYQKTVDILIRAYFNDTLVHGDCAACAVGNIVMANCGYTFSYNNRDWVEAPIYPDFTDAQNWFFPVRDGKSPNKRQQKEIESTGYSIDELNKIESAFEGVEYSLNREDRIFNALMAVIGVLDQIHENTDTITTQETKNKFTRKLQTT